MTLLESINKRAEEKYPEFSDTSNEAAYISGCKDQYELDMKDMLEFAEWSNYNYLYAEYGNGEMAWFGDTPPLLIRTTSELFEYWFKKVKGK